MSTSVLRYRYRAYPNGKQQRAAARLFGGCRVAFNAALEHARNEHAAGNPYPKANGLQRHVLTEGKKQPERAWMNQLCGVALIQAVRDADMAYRNFFASCTGGRKGRRVGFPRFRSRRDSTQTARFTKAARFAVTAVGDRRAAVRLTGIGEVEFVLSRELPSAPSSVTLIREADGRFYVSFVVEEPDATLPGTDRVCGVDMGLSRFATVVTSESGSETITATDTPKFLRRKARALARSQRAMSRKQKGSRNRDKARRKVAVHHRKVRNARLDHAHQLATEIVTGHDVIAVENLSVAGMSRTNGASVHDQSMSQFLRVLADKSRRHGRSVVAVSRWFPSTRMCSGCGQLTGPHGKKDLSVRQWTCASCGVSHDRDVNAARNILAEGLRLLAEQRNRDADGLSESLNACGDETAAPPEGKSFDDEAGRLPGDREP
ncbi:transposase [Mycobacterium koreense]|uniref:RNA-guided endonuclease InsQ/TnpB family protein n=1 Tax=Mycolicibacillus koreensis TaxID=1069220 RepID=UPI0013D4FC35|nr:RNA-guided endonuclease TnpB family protein [Mycolicibacillus koreensis]MCV7247636.1 transposase [Mycolicibacillus koreensis]